jgi:hypothetical protein
VKIHAQTLVVLYAKNLNALKRRIAQFHVTQIHAQPNADSPISLTKLSAVTQSAATHAAKNANNLHVLRRKNAEDSVMRNHVHPSVRRPFTTMRTSVVQRSVN